MTAFRSFLRRTISASRSISRLIDMDGPRTGSGSRASNNTTRPGTRPARRGVRESLVMSPEQHRTFLAAYPDRPTLERVEEWISTFRERYPGIRWSPESQLHFT